MIALAESGSTEKHQVRWPWEIAGGRFGTASEVVRAGLRLLELEERKLEALRAAIDAGDRSPESKDVDGKQVFAGVRSKLKLKRR